ncbi:MAG TPA: sugar transferase [Roseimicrobium sp.]|nr:sugar transferase [Roseimicrobium sp.]
MLRRQQQIRARLNEWIDSGLFGLSFWLAHVIRDAFPNAVWQTPSRIEPFSEFIWLWLVIIPFAPLILDAQGYYQRGTAITGRETAWRALKACFLAATGVVLLMFLLKIQLARSVVMLFGPVAFVLLMLKELMIERWGLTRMGQNEIRKRFILVGTPADTGRIISELGANQHSDLEILATLDLSQTPVETLADLLHQHSANGVLICAQHTLFGQIEKAIQLCELEGVEAWLLADFFKTNISQTTLDEFQGRPTLVFRSTPEVSWQMLAKKLIDMFGAAVLLVLTSWLMLIAAIAVRITSPGPILFRQRRAGLNGQPFVMLKFRSMDTDAEQRQQELAAFNEMDGPVFKATHDPRITKVGKTLRRYSIDELPQLWNVLRGEMSLVGPRPLPVEEVQRFDNIAHRRRLSVKPGLTCLWQVSGRNEVKSFKDWVRLDLEYIDNWSLWLDFKILLRTVPAVLLGTGAK